MIYVNGRFLANKTDGISRFSIEICKRLKIEGLIFSIIIPSWLDYENTCGFNLVKFGMLKSHFWEQIDLLRFLKINDNPLLVNFSGIGPVFYKNQAITIHDLSFFVNKKWFSIAYTLFYNIATPIAAKNAIKVITVSDFSRTEIIKFLKLPAKKIEVVNNAVSNHLIASDDNISQPSVFSGKYVLTVSSIDPRKNLQRLINVFSNNDIENCSLVIVGKSTSHFNIKLECDNEKIVLTGFISDKELLSLYKNCELFIYPSLYEGFGIPVLEAMRNGCAVVTSDIPSLKEVCGDGAVYVDPYDEVAIKEGILKVLKNIEFKKELKKRGQIRAEQFTWEKSGRKMFELIKSLC